MNSGSGPLRVTSPVPRAVWESLLLSNENAVVTQSLPWRDAVFASGRYQDVSALYEFSSGRQVILPMARPRWQPPWAAAVASWPRVWSAGGPISQEGRVTPAEAAAVLADVARRGTLTMNITLSHCADKTWLSEARQFRIEKDGCYILDLTGGFATVWQDRFRGTARTAIRKAERSGLEVEVDRSGQLLGVFYDLHEKSIRYRAAQMKQPVWLTRWRMNLVSPTFPGQLASVARNFGKDCATWVARFNGEPVAAIVVLSSGAYAKYWRGAMNKELGGPTRANDLLHRLAIEQACCDGSRFYDLGGTPLGSSLAAFKEKLGATLQFTHSLHAERPPVYAIRAARQHTEGVIKKIVHLREM